MVREIKKSNLYPKHGKMTVVTSDVRYNIILCIICMMYLKAVRVDLNLCRTATNILNFYWNNVDDKSYN